MRAAIVILQSFLIYGFQFSLAIKCLHYNKTDCNINAGNCETVKECDAKDKYNCYVLWRNSTSELKEKDVQLKGCFIANAPECLSDTECVEKDGIKNNGLLFCCCKGDLCNKNFQWIYTPAPSPSEVAGSNFDNSKMSLVIIAFSISLAVFVILMILAKRRNVQPSKKIPPSDQILSHSTPESRRRSSLVLLEIIAQGKFGTVWKAADNNRTVAVKIMPIQEKKSWLTEKEIYQLPLMNHDNILQFIAAEKNGDSLHAEFWLITAFHELGSLHDFLERNTVTWEQLTSIAHTMSLGLSHLHEECTKSEYHKPAVAHRDLKSSNVLLKDDRTACIADFGLALIFCSSCPPGDSHTQVGTRRYMAPEILEGAINFSRDSFLRIDMYACGLVLWELVSRCSAQLGPVPDYKLPFEKEIGQHPSLESIQDEVVHKKSRPVIEQSWREHPGLNALCDTIEELWDHDAEARISACCVVQRTTPQNMPVPVLSSNTPLMFDV